MHTARAGPDGAVGCSNSNYRSIRPSLLTLSARLPDSPAFRLPPVSPALGVLRWLLTGITSQPRTTLGAANSEPNPTALPSLQDVTVNGQRAGLNQLGPAAISLHSGTISGTEYVLYKKQLNDSVPDGRMD